MRLFRISNFLFLGMAVLCGVLLFWTSQNVQLQEKGLEKMRQDLAQEIETVRVLSVEWDYLNRPERLEELASGQLGMVPPQSGQVVVSTQQIPEPLVVPTNPAYFQEVSTPAKQEAAPKPVKETLSPSKAEKQSFEKLLEELDRQGGNDEPF